MSARPDPLGPSPETREIDEDEAILAAVRAGQGVSHAAVRRWLLSKDTAEPLPRPDPGD